MPESPSTRLPPPDHRFFARSREQQNRLLALFVLVTLAGVLAIVAVAFWTGAYAVTLLAAVWIMVCAPFIDVPTGARSGKLWYWSALLIAERPRDGRMRLHGATLFDYAFILDRRTSRPVRRQRILSGYMGGLRALIDAFQSGEIDDVLLTGTTHIAGPRTLSRLGFETRPLEPVQTVLLIMNFPLLFLAESFANGRLVIPRVGRIRSFECRVSELARRRDRIGRVLAHLQRSMIDAPHTGVDT